MWQLACQLPEFWTLNCAATRRHLGECELASRRLTNHKTCGEVDIWDTCSRVDILQSGHLKHVQQVHNCTSENSIVDNTACIHSTSPCSRTDA